MAPMVAATPPPRSRSWPFQRRCAAVFEAQVVLAAQQPEAAAVLIQRCAEVGAKVYREGVEFGLLERTPAVGGQVIRIDSASGSVGDLVLRRALGVAKDREVPAAMERWRPERSYAVFQLWASTAW